MSREATRTFPTSLASIDFLSTGIFVIYWNRTKSSVFKTRLFQNKVALQLPKTINRGHVRLFPQLAWGKMDRFSLGSRVLGWLTLAEYYLVERPSIVQGETRVRPLPHHHKFGAFAMWIVHNNKTDQILSACLPCKSLPCNKTINKEKTMTLWKSLNGCQSI